MLISFCYYSILWYKRQGNFKAIKLYIKLGFDINKENSDGATPLMGAVVGNRNSIVKYLIKHNANPNIRHNNGTIALDLAKLNKNQKIISILKPITTVKGVYNQNNNSRDLKNLCLAESGKYPSFCYNINDSDMKNYCLGVTKYPSSCYNINDSDTKNSCLASTKYPSSCYNINDSDNKNACNASTKHCPLFSTSCRILFSSINSILAIAAAQFTG